MVNWGDPRTLDRFWAVVSATQYHQYLALIGPVEWFNRLFDGIIQIGQQMSWAGLGLALVGGYTLWHQDRAIAGYLASLILPGRAKDLSGLTLYTQRPRGA